MEKNIKDVKKKIMKVAYVPMCADLLHHGHINILEEARTLADYVIVGLVSDEAIKRYKKPPILNQEQRTKIMKAIRYVDEVRIEDDDSLFLQSVADLKPDFVIHGNDWADPKAKLFHIRRLIKIRLKNWGGKLVEPSYTKGISSTQIKTKCGL